MEYNEDLEYINPIPPRSEDLIKQLAQDYPTVRVSPSDSHAYLMYHGGQRALVEILLERLNQTNELNIKGDIKL